MVNDPLSDFLARIKNGYMAHRDSVDAPYSKMKEEIARILKARGYVAGYKTSEENNRKTIVVELKYNGLTAAIEGITRVSKPGQRVYEKTHKIPHVLTGYGMAIVSTSKGIMTDKEARKAKLGGEVLCKIW